jgi:uncharacterized membrane protein YhaH (DUF805 family)/cold shock CspA family protein
MRGEVLHYDDSQGFGFIATPDGSRYSFAREDLRRAAPMPKGTMVEFQPSGGRAKDIFSIRAQQQGHVAAPAAPPPPQHFGRTAVAEPPARPSLWGYFRGGLTRNYANFQGRAGRREYWGYILFWTLAMIAVVSAGMASDDSMGNLDGSEVPWLTVTLLVLILLASIVPWVAMLVRRLHDIGMAGWFCLLILPFQFVLVPIGLLLVFVFGMIPSDPKENAWGAPPAGAAPASG